MAWLELDRRTRHFKVAFRLGDRRIKRSLRTADADEASDALAVVADTLRAVERGWISIPENVDAGQFLLSGGRVTEALVLPRSLRLSELFDAYFGNLPEGSLEQSTIDGMRIHQRHLYRILGKSFDMQSLRTPDLQRYIERRSKERGRRGRKVTPTTIKKAVVTLQTIWNWGVKTGRLTGTFPTGGLKYSKSVEKPPFQTWQEIERQIARGSLSETEQADLWDCLFLSIPEIEELLRYVERNARYSWIYPAVCVAAHTGSRRSEIIRCKLTDLDLDRAVLTIHERKRNRERQTTRRVPISPFLQTVMRDWLTKHPGGMHAFGQTGRNARSRKFRDSIEPITRDEAHKHLRRTLNGSKWAVIRGWHIFRHSFCSNCAARGIDQRIINSWTGHQTEEMVRRYRHQFPEQQQSAIQVVFGTPKKGK